jgi:hypothetical protein
LADDLEIRDWYSLAYLSTGVLVGIDKPNAVWHGDGKSMDTTIGSRAGNMLSGNG